MNCSVAHKNRQETVSLEEHTVSNIRRRRSTDCMCCATKLDFSQKAQIQHKETQNLLRPYHHDTCPSLKIKCFQLKKAMKSKASVVLIDTLSRYA
jgi:sensor c-di-GMP phosphodiesterase-like protein